MKESKKKPRKDYETYSTILDNIWYMYDSMFDESHEYEFQKITDKNEISCILNTYMNNYFDESDDKDTWFSKIKLLCEKLGYASDMKAYKQNPDDYKGNITDVTTVIRVALTTRSMTPDLYELLKLIGKERAIKRFSKFYC